MQGINIRPRELRRVDQPLDARGAWQGAIAILTFHRCINYGSYWQARCLAEGMAAATGAPVRILDHASRGVEIKEWRCALRPELTSPGDRKAHAGRIRAFARARGALPLGRRFELSRPETAGRHGTVVVGSDEVWNFRHPWYAASTPFFGEGVAADRLVAYAASFGNHDAADGIHPEYCARLRRFAAISVRDRNSARLIREALGIKPEMVLDPCLLFPDCIDAGEPDEEPGLILYGHDFPGWIVEQVRGFAKARGLRIVSLGYHNWWADEQRLAAGPEAFGRMMAGAAAVVTNFFHGCVFSLVFGRPFATAPSDYRFNKIRDLADLLGAEHRIVGPRDGAAVYARLLSEPVPHGVEARIASLRRASSDYLRAALAA
ncbi:MAG TPA: polysaccharide pyruvyl transferase family protein [Novosphingobium sp.]|nr:polysaccharide pyruvyl transferase family protein [Novosphingobium sp.]